MPVRTTRRRLLQGGLWGAVAFAAGLFVRTRGYASRDGLPPLRVLAPWQHTLLTHVARRIAAGDAQDAPSPDDLDVAGFIDRQLVSMPSEVKRDLGRCFVYVEQLAPLACGYASRFTKLDGASQDVVLGSLESSRIGDLRGAFEGLKALVMMGYYRAPQTWKLLGYEGPQMGQAS